MVEAAGVAEVHLGRLDDAFADVLEPRRQHPDHEGAGQEVAVVVHGVDADAHRAGERRGVPGPRVDVGEHRPEAAERLGRHPGAESRNVALQERARERLHPQGAGLVRLGQVGQRESAAHPEPVLVLGSHLVEREAAHVDERDAPGQGLGHAPDQVPGGAAQKQEDGLPLRVVADRAENLEELRDALHLVDHDQPLAASKEPLRSRAERLANGGHFQVVDRGGPRPRRHDLLGERRLADLPGAQEGGDRRPGESPECRVEKVLSGDRLSHIHPRRGDLRQ